MQFTSEYEKMSAKRGLMHVIFHSFLYALGIRLSILNGGVNYLIMLTFDQLHASTRFWKIQYCCIRSLFISPYICQSIIIVASGVWWN